jgi:nicotinamidase-related amidase
MTRQKFTRDNTAVLMIDHQVGLFTGVRDINVNELKHNVVGLARAAQALGLWTAPQSTRGMTNDSSPG